MSLELPQYNVTLIDFQTIHLSFEKSLMNELHDLHLIDSLPELRSDSKRLITHYIIKETVDFINNYESNNKIIVYFNNTQFNDSEMLKYIDEVVYLKLLTKVLLKIRSVLPIKVVISSKSLDFFSHLLTIDDGRAKGTLYRIVNTINKFKVENYTFEKVKKYAKLYGLNFLSKDYFNDIKTKHIAFR